MIAENTVTEEVKNELNEIKTKNKKAIERENLQQMNIHLVLKIFKE